MTDIRKIQRIMFGAMRKSATLCDQNAEGASILLTILGETIAALATELIANGQTVYTPDGVEKTVRGTVDPIEKMLRENLAEYLRKQDQAAKAAVKQ
jgi:hypothetical protein